jgi:uncharacterized metal-binding protein YceD (DUF177 family)
MRLFLKNLVIPQPVNISGNEEWLQPLYKGFPAPKSGTPPRLTGELLAKQAAEGTSVQISGSLRYKPFVDCSRCGKALQMDLNAQVDALYQPEPEILHEKNVHNLSESELDQYYLGEGNSVDLEGLINDLIHLELPDRPVCEDKSRCAPDKEEDSPLWSSEAGAPAKENPFAVLAKLNIGDKH